MFTFIDLASVSRGLFKESNIDYEINKFIENNRELSTSLLDELRYYCNNLYNKFKQYNLMTLIHYDDGFNLQNTIINSTYKEGRSALKNLMPDLERRELFKKLKLYWFQLIEEHFSKNPNLSKVYYLREYESDLIPYYFIKNNKMDSQNSKYMKLILSNDKDLLQVCAFPSTYMITNTWRNDKITKRKILDIKLYDKYNAIKYIDDKFTIGNLTADYISLILSIAGDTSDSIQGIPGIGIKKAIKLIENNNISSNINEFRKNKNFLPAILQENFDLILNNYKLIDFDEQLNRTKILD